MGIGLPNAKKFTLRVTKMSYKHLASQKPMFAGLFDGQKSPLVRQVMRWQALRDHQAASSKPPNACK